MPGLPAPAGRGMARMDLQYGSGGIDKARLPSECWLIQQIGGEVVLFEEGTEREIVRFSAADSNAAARAQKVIYDSELSPEDKAFAHFWSGYFYAHASGPE